MEAVGLASGIAGLITLAIQVSGAIHEYSAAIKNKSKTIEELGNEISTLSNALTEFHLSLQKEDHQALKFDEDCVLSRAYVDCKKRIERIGQVFLDTQNGSRVRRAWNKVLWPFQQKEAVQMVDNLRRFTQVFSFAVNIRNRTILAQTSANVSGQLSKLHLEIQEASENLKSMPDMIRMLQEDALKHTTLQLQAILDLLPTLAQQTDDISSIKKSMQIAEERELHQLKGEILNWLVPSSGVPKHHELQKKRGKDTCQWFLQDQSFVRWAGGEENPGDFLCVGGPGTGKTVLCSIVIDHLQKAHVSKNVAILHYYCDFFEKTVQSASHFARSLLRQLLQASKGIPAVVSEFYRNTNHHMQDVMWLQQLNTVLVKVIATFDNCFLVLDAIDETDVKEQRKSLFEVLNALRGSKGRLHTLATSRPHITDIEQEFPNITPFEIGASPSDISNFLNWKIDESPLSSEILDNALRSEIISGLCEIAQGMFLLPALQIDHILEQVTTGGARRALKNLSTTLPGVFQSTMNRILEFPQVKKDLAMKTLLWISHAERTLTIPELQHALAVHLEEQEFDVDDIPAVNTIIESCCGLVELVGDPMDENPRYVTFVHFSLQEFLLGKSTALFLGGDLFITKACLKYLSFKSLHFVAQGNRKTLLRTLVHFPFLEYASLFWGYHAVELSIESYQNMAMALFNDRDALFLALRVRDARNPNDSEWEETTTRLIDSGSGGISIAASFGLASLLQLIIKGSTRHDLNVKNIYGSTPLHECAINGSIDTAKVLVANGANLLSVNKGGATPFYLAVAFDRIELCRFLLEAGPEQINIAKNDGYTPLHKACDYGTHEMITLLVKAGAKLNVANDAQKCGKMTPLHLACRRGNLPAVHVLVHAGADLERRTKDGCCALDLVATNGFLDIAQYLIQNGASLDGKSRGGWTPLHRAARAGQVDVARLLLESKANLLERDFRRSLPLTLAVKRGEIACVKLFLEYSPMFTLHQLENLDIEFETAKIKAYSTAHYDLYKYLRDLESQLRRDDKDSGSSSVDPTTPLTKAIEGGSMKEVIDILDSNPDLLMIRDSLGQMPIHVAFVEGQADIAVELLDRGVPVDARGYHDLTPLHIAAGAGSIRMVSVALQYNASIHAESISKNNALHKAASSLSMPVFLELLRCGSDPYIRNNHEMTALHVAANHNFFEAAKELLKPKWQTLWPEQEKRIPLILAKDKRDHTPRWWAENGGHLELADFLRLEEKKARSGLKIDNNRPTSSRRSTPRQPSAFSRTSTASSTVTSTSLSHSTTLENLSRRTSRTSLLTPPINSFKPGHFARRSTESLFSYDEEGDSRSEGLPSPARTPTTPGEAPLTPGLRDESMQRVERRFAEMLLELEAE